jgi:hypothetical protein
MMIFRPHVLTVCLLCLLVASVVEAGDALDSYNVIWTTPSANSDGSMPIGNGEMGLNVWVEEGGDLLFYLARTDAWSGNGRLLKLGRIRVKLTPNPFAKGLPFRQELKLREGEIEIVAGQADRSVQLRVWVDASAPVVHVDVDGAQPLEVRASLEVWRTKQRTLAGAESKSAYGIAMGPDPVVVEPDVVLPAAGNRVTWYHRNGKSCYPVTLKVQGLESLLVDFPDPLLGRTFGGCIRGEGFVSVSDSAISSAEPRKQHRVSVHTMTSQTENVKQWVKLLDEAVAEVDETPVEAARAKHRAWWAAFWDRSWIHVTAPPPGAPAGAVTTNALPLRIGADSSGKNHFRGRIARVRMYDAALPDEKIQAMAAEGVGAAVGDAKSLAAGWRFGQLVDGVFVDASGDGHVAKIVGRAEVVDDAKGKVLKLDGRGYLQVKHSPKLDLAGGFTLEAWIAPDRLPAGGARIVDKSKAGTADGYLLDTHPGNSLRSIVAAGTLIHKADLAPGTWVHVAASCDAETGRRALFINGRRVAAAGAESTDDRAVARGYALQRWINACAGRGAFPIKFNGSLFTVDATDKGGRYDADYRRWGGCYWFQNTRLPYWSMPMAGDFDLVAPLLRMYLRALPLARTRTQFYYGHAGAYFPETMYFWGTYNNDNYGWNRKGKPDGRTDNTYIRHYWSGSLELAALMLDCYAITQDSKFARGVLLPFATDVVAFYDEHYRRGQDGKLHIAPAQSLETWHEATNPTPVIAGLRHVIGRLLAELPQDVTSSRQREEWGRLRRQLPALPMTPEGKRRVLPAATFGKLKNSENPELYTVFPYRLYSVGKRDLDVGRATYEARRVKRTGGWTQDPIQAAMLGLAHDAARDVYTNFTRRSFRRGDNPSRFSAFWGPNFDWIPDQDQGGVAMVALQRMCMQTEGKAIHVLPAWPKEWDVHFKLHAPYRTVVECIYRDGKIEKLTVTPPHRAADVVRMEPQ